MQPLTIASITAQPGEKKQQMLDVRGTALSMPVTLMCGAKEGKTVLISAGVHGAEYPGIQAAIELAQELDPKELCGNIVWIHPINTQGFKARVCSIVPEDGKNLNRVFPGDENGSATERLAYMLCQEFYKKADFYLDLHSGDMHEELHPYVYFPGKAEESVTERSRAVAQLLDMDYMVRSGGVSEAYNGAAALGCPSLLIERGGRGLWSRDEVEAYKKDVRNVLRHLDVLPSAPEPVIRHPREIAKAYYLNAGEGGCWYPQVKAGEKIAKGQLLGTVKDYFGKEIDSFYAEADGVVLYLTVSLAIKDKGSLIAYGVLD